MPLVVISGFPSSGKTRRSQQLQTYFEERIAKSTHPSHSNLTVVHISDETLNIPRSVYAEARTEKDARASLSSACKRELGQNRIVILDALNYIKGFRYQLFCEAKAATTPYCVVHVGVAESQCREWNNQSLERADGTGYDKDLFDNLVFRYEEPNGMNRWDSPLFTVLQDDESPPGTKIWDAIIGEEGQRKTMKANLSTVAPKVASGNALQQLDSVTQSVISSIESYQRESEGMGGGQLKFDGLQDPLFLPSQPVSSPQLQRLRRTFIQLRRRDANAASSMNQQMITEGFVSYLNSEWETN